MGLIDESNGARLPVLAAAIFVSATTGLRRGELCGLRWSDLDLSARTLTVARAVKHDDGPGWSVGLRRLTRSAGSPSTTPRSPCWPGTESSWRLRHTPLTSLGSDGYVFTLDPSGAEPWRPDSYTQAFNRICHQTCPDCRAKRRGTSCATCGGKRVTKRFDVTVQELRHFTVTQAVAAGIDIVTTFGRVGHGADVGLRKYAAFVPVPRPRGSGGSRLPRPRVGPCDSPSITDAAPIHDVACTNTGQLTRYIRPMLKHPGICPSLAALYADSVEIPSRLANSGMLINSASSAVVGADVRRGHTGLRIGVESSPCRSAMCSSGGGCSWRWWGLLVREWSLVEQRRLDAGCPAEDNIGYRLYRLYVAGGVFPFGQSGPTGGRLAVFPMADIRVRWEVGCCLPDLDVPIAGRRLCPGRSDGSMSRISSGRWRRYPDRRRPPGTFDPIPGHQSGRNQARDGAGGGVLGDADARGDVADPGRCRPSRSAR